MVLNENFRITVISLPDRENLVSEIFYKGEQWVEISHENKDLMVQFYPPVSSDFWEFPLDEAIEALEIARNKLLEVG